MATDNLTPAPDANETERAMAAMRYDLEQQCRNYESYGVMVPYGQHGDWVKAEDFDALCAKVRELQRELDRCTRERDKWESNSHENNRAAWEMTAERDAAQGEAKRLAMALHQYGDHLPICGTRELTPWDITPCDCGLEEHLATEPIPLPLSATTEAQRDVAAERRRQIESEGWTPEHDDEHSGGQMAIAAACYALNAGFDGHPEMAAAEIGHYWPWDATWWKPMGPRRDLVRAASLLIAEIERLDRALTAHQPAKGQ